MWLVLEFQQTSEGQLSFDALNAFEPQVRESAEIYYWPSEFRERNPGGRLGKLHAKCAVIDSNAIVSSANLTDDAFTRNMELGVLLKNNLMANELWWHLETMIQQGFLHKVSDFSD
jgi:phosphatidylserine/phosphatidylglycerophosphate/cardiolipin synthase-like enzyme